MSDFWLSLVTNIGTIGLLIFITDRAFKLAHHWLDLQNERTRFLSREQVRGPKPIRLTQEIREENPQA